jgi:hypothetical protein
LLGFFGYYRSYIPNFSRKFEPLYRLLKTKKDDKTKKDGGVRSKKMNKKSRGADSKLPIQWTAGMLQVVEETIEYLQSPSFLVFPDYIQPFMLNCDASEKGLGAVLYEHRDGKPRVVSY